MSPSLIQDPDSLARLCEQLRNRPWVTLDTEFMRTRTYYARLCLVQVATPTIVACVDTLALPSIEPLLEVIYSPRMLKIIHAARQDLEVFADLRGTPPGPVFDTQVAASLCGYDDQIGYGSLVESITGHKLPKLHTRANWEIRPLPPGQINYAEDDVRYLRDVYQVLSANLESLGRNDWLTEECAALTDPQLYRNDPREAFRRLKQGQSLPPEAQTVLRELAAWRELAAQQNDLPRGWVASDAALLEIVSMNPKSPEEISRIVGLSAPTHKWAGDILDAITRGRAMAPERLWDEPSRLNRRQQTLYKQLQNRACSVATRLKISSTLLAPRRELLKLIIGDPSGALSNGWRRTLIGEELMRLCIDNQDPAATT